MHCSLATPLFQLLDQYISYWVDVTFITGAASPARSACACARSTWWCACSMDTIGTANSCIEMTLLHVCTATNHTCMHTHTQTHTDTHIRHTHRHTHITHTHTFQCLISCKYKLTGAGWRCTMVINTALCYSLVLYSVPYDSLCIRYKHRPVLNGIIIIKVRVNIYFFAALK